MNPTKFPFSRMQGNLGLMPQEEMLEVGRNAARLTIGIPKETTFQENRIPLTPAAVALLCAHGHEIAVETGAGINAHFADKDYADAGARIVYQAKETFDAGIVLKISPPTPEESDWIRPKQFICSAVQSTNQYGDIVRKLVEKKATALAYNYLKDDDGFYPVVRSMGEIAGSASLLIAAEYLSNVNQGKGIMLGGVTGVPPVEVIIIGAGIVGESALRTAIGLGAQVRVFDNNLTRLSRLQQHLGGQRVFTSLISGDELSRRLTAADVVIGALRAPEGRTPMVVSEDMVRSMKPGAVIIDVSIDQGGCFETSEITNHQKPTFKKYGVTHYCVPNISSRVAQTASIALSNIFSPMLIDIGQAGGYEDYLRYHHGSRSGIYVFHGMVTNKYFAGLYDLPLRELDLIMAAL